MRYLLRYIFLMYFAELPTHIYSIWLRFFSFQTYFWPWGMNDKPMIASNWEKKRHYFQFLHAKLMHIFQQKLPGHLSSYKRSLLPAAASIAYVLWQYGLWSFQAGGTKLERFLQKNQNTQRKLLNFEFWINGELSKSA